METNNWRNEESRQKIVNKIMDTLQTHMPQTGADGMNELKKIALRFEEKIYTVSINQQDYLRRISLKMLSLESKVNGPSNHFPGSSSGNNQRPLDPGGMMIRPQTRNQTQAPGNSLPLTGQPQLQQPMLPQSLQNSISAGGMPSSAGLVPSLCSIPNGLPTMQGIPYNLINSSTGQVLPHLLASNQRQLQSRQQQHQQHQPFQHQLQQQQQAILNKKLQQQSQIQSSILQLQQSASSQSHLQPSQQSILQPAQRPALQSNQQSILQQSQPSILQPTQQSVLQSAVQQASQSSLQQHQQSILRQQQSQQSVIQRQQQSSMVQQSILQPQQQHQQQLLGQQNMQQQQHQHQIQQFLQSKYQQTQQTLSSLLQSQSQQLQQQSQQQQPLSQLQSQIHPLQQQQRLLQQSNPIQQELQRLQTTEGLLQQQQPSSIEQQKQLSQQRGMSEAYSTSMESSGQTGQPTVADWQEKVYQRLQNLKDMYYPVIEELFTKLSTKCQQPMQPDQFEKLKDYKTTLHRMMTYFKVQKSTIPQGFTEDKVDVLENQIQAILNSFKQRKSAPQQQGLQQLPSQANNQVKSMQQQENHVNPLQKSQQSQQQQLQQQSQQQQLLSQLQSHTHPLEQQQRLLQQSNPIQQELQRLQTTGGLLQWQQPSSIEQQKQLLQQRGLSEASSSSMESSGQTGQPTVADWQLKVYQRLQNLKDMYYPVLEELFTELSTKCQQPMQPDQFEKLKHYKTTLHRMMTYFKVQKSSIPPGFTEDKVDALENQIQAILNSFKQRKSAPQQQGQKQLPTQANNQVKSMQQQENHVNPLQKSQQLQQQQLQQQSQQQQLLSQLQSHTHPSEQQQRLLQQSNPIQQELQRLQTTGGLLQQQQPSSTEQQKQLLQQRGLSEASSTSMESSGQTGQPTVADWQEKVYQRLQNLKDIYYPVMEELVTKLSTKCQQPMQPDQFEKLKNYKTTLQHMMTYFKVQKSGIPPGFTEDKVDALENQIQAFLNSFKQRKSSPQQQGHQQLPMQPNNQVQSMQQKEKHVNPLQQMNLQPSVTSMQPNTATSIQHSSMPLLQQSGGQTSHQNI